MLAHQTAKPCSDVEVTYKVGYKYKTPEKGFLFTIKIRMVYNYFCRCYNVLAFSRRINLYAFYIKPPSGGFLFLL